MDRTVIKRPSSLIIVTANFLFIPFICTLQNVLLLSNTASNIHAFTVDSNPSYQSHHRSSIITDHFASFLIPPLFALKSDDDDIFGDDGDDDDLERISPEEVDYGKYMDSNFDLEKILDTDEIVAEASEIIEETIEKNRLELIALKKSVGEEYEKSKAKSNSESKIRAEAEAKRLMKGFDRLAEDFLDTTRVAREGTKMAARADRLMEGKGLELGSWGTVGGFDVLTEGDKDNGGKGGLLGSVAAADERARTAAARRMDQDGEEVKEWDSKILIICDGKKDAKMQRVLDCFTTLLSTSSLPTTTTTNYLPTAILPMGGDGAQTLIIVSSSLSNGRSSAESMLARLLKRSLPTGGGAILPPPSHLVVLSSVGSSRTDKFPYSMQNLVGGGKLGKMYEVEECIVSTVKGRMVLSDGIRGVPSDYTVIKFGELVDDTEVAKKNKGNLDSESHDHSVTIRPGDSLDGAVGIQAAANVLLQTVAIQPNARNATMSVIGGMTTADGGNIMWEDAFLRMDGPELWRIEEKDLWNNGNGNEGDADRAFATMTTYLEEWSAIFDNGAMGTGLTTPVTVVSPKLKVFQGGDEDTLLPSIRARWSLRLEFKATRTGSAYKSKSEEKQAERERNNISTPRSSSSTSNSKEPAIKITKANKEGGVEILVEKTTRKDGLIGIRVRARRCNMSDFTVVKEISEETIVKRVQEALTAWKKS